MSSLEHKPAGARWEFDADVTLVFDDMLARSIPAYDAMRKLTHELAARHVTRRSLVVDLGTSRGGAIRRMLDDARFSFASFVALEAAPAMLSAARDTIGRDERVSVVEHDLRSELPVDASSASVILSVLTLQFTPIEYRSRILSDAHDALHVGGALLLVEKVTGAHALTDRALVELYYDEKGAHGYDEPAIAAKRRALEGVLVPLSASFNEQALQAAGFRIVECYWRHLNFAAWIAVK